MFAAYILPRWTRVTQLLVGRLIRRATFRLVFITALLSEPPPRHAQKTTTEGGENGKGSKRRDSTPTNCGGGGVRDVSMNEGTAVQQFFSLLISLLFSSSSSHIIQVSLSLRSPFVGGVEGGSQHKRHRRADGRQRRRRR